jgi:hypothetical protein
MGKDKGVVLDIERAAKGSSWQNSYATVFHEFGHNIDNLVGEKEGPFSFCKFSAEYESGLFQKTLREDIEANITTLDKRLKAEFKKHSTDVDWLRANNYLGQYEEFNLSHGIPIKPKYTKSQAYFKFKQELKAIPQKQLAQLSDIVEGCTGNRVECGFGHGKSYWKDRPDGVGAEAFAEFYEATMTNPEARAVLDKYLPKAAKVFDDMLAEILKGEW